MQYSILPLLTVLFIGLKLCHVIAWSWWYVLMPTWIPMLVAAVCIVIWLFMLIFKKGKKS